MASVTVACVLRSGGAYRQQHVEKLRRSVDKWLSADHEFFCLDDSRMIRRWPGWWSKIELFRPGLFNGRVLYLDLDNVIVGPLDPLYLVRGIVFMRDFFLGDISTAVMSWEGDQLANIYEAFAANQRHWMDPARKVNPRQSVYGDQSFVQASATGLGLRWRFFQDLRPGRITPWNKPLESASVACFMGRHKPWNSTGWAADAWKAA